MVRVTYADGDPLGLRLRIAPGADLTADPSTYSWTEITSDLQLREAIAMTRGTADEQGQTNSSADLVLRNPDGRYTPDNPESDLWPNFDLNCPIDLAVNLGDGGGWRTRAVQYLSDISPVWPDMTPHGAEVVIATGGLFRRMGQGKRKLSAMRRAIEPDAPIAWWPLDDGSQSTAASSGLEGGASMTVASGAPGFGGIDGPIGSGGKAMLLMSTAGTALGTLSAAADGVSATGWTVEAWVEAVLTPGALSADVRLVDWTTSSSDVPRWRIGMSGPSGRITLYAVDAADSTLVFWTSGAANPHPTVDGAWHHVRVSVEQDGSDVQVQMHVDGLLVVDDPWVGKTAGAVRKIQAPYVTEVWTTTGFDSAGVASISVYDTPTIDDHYAAGIGHLGEEAHTRIARICTENGFPSAVTASRSTAMGVQPIASVLEILRDCETTDHGVLDDSQGVVAYRALSELYNQTPEITLNGLSRELFGPFAPIRNDAKRLNTARATRPGGGSRPYTDAADVAKVGTYEGDVAVNVSSDDALTDHAAWRAAIGTTPGMRYPSLTLDLLVAPQLVVPAMGLQLGDAVTLANPPRQHAKGDIALQVRGWTETISGRRRGWQIVANAVRADPYNVFVVAGTGNSGRLDASSSTLTADVEVSATSFQVSTTGTLLTTTTTFPGDFPLDVNIGGERMTVTAITSATSPQTLTVTRAVNGVRKRHRAGTAVRLWAPRGLAL